MHALVDANTPTRPGGPVVGLDVGNGLGARSRGERVLGVVEHVDLDPEGARYPEMKAEIGPLPSPQTFTVCSAARSSAVTLSAISLSETSWCTSSNPPGCTRYCSVKTSHISFGVISVPVSSVTVWMTRENSICNRRQDHPMLVLHHVGDTALARLRVHADHRLVRPSDVVRIDRQVRDVPVFEAFPKRFHALFDRARCDPEKAV